MKSKRFSKLKIFGLAILGLVAVHYIFFRAPSEAQMIAKFHQRKAEFEQIRLMLKQDKNVGTIGNNWIEAQLGPDKIQSPKNKKQGIVTLHRLPLNLSASRIALYRSRLRKLGFSRVDAHDGRVQLEQFGGGFTDTTWGIGYMWSAKPLTPLVKSAYWERPNKDDRHFSHIEGNWYMYHRR